MNLFVSLVSFLIMIIFDKLNFEDFEVLVVV